MFEKKMREDLVLVVLACGNNSGKTKKDIETELMFMDFGEGGVLDCLFDLMSLELVNFNEGRFTISKKAKKRIADNRIINFIISKKEWLDETLDV